MTLLSATDHVTPDRAAVPGFATWLIALLGSSTLAGFIVTLSGGPGAADLDAATMFVSSAFAGLALTIGSSIAIAALIRGNIQGFAAVNVAALSLGAGIFIANAVGIGTVGWDVVQAQVSIAGGGPISVIIGLLAACVIIYGVVGSLQALICGGLLGYWLNLLRD